MLGVLAGGEPGPTPRSPCSRRPAIRLCDCSAGPRRAGRHLDDYRARGGYAALRRAFELGPEGVIRELKDSKLQGRGGAAFPTGVKWEAVARQPVRPHYLVCNADESEPGTFKDRVIIERDPFALIEAMTIAAYATGCEHGYVYLRGEYPRARSTRSSRRSTRRAAAVSSATTCSARASRFDVEIRKGAGAYICGEETAIFNSIEGNRGEPRNKPPFPVVAGLFGKPTVVNNVETLVNVLDDRAARGPRLRRDRHGGLDGHEALLPLRPRRAPGRLRGAVRHDAAASCSSSPAAWPAARALQAVLLGGAAGGFVRPDELDLPLTFEAAREAQTTLGSGVVLVLDDTVDLPPAADADRGLLPQRVVRPVRSLPRRHRAPAGGARPARLRPAERRRSSGAGVIARDGAVHARRVDLRPRPDGVERDRVRDRAPRRVPVTVVS